MAREQKPVTRPDAETWAAVEAADWDDLTLRLVRYAQNRARLGPKGKHRRWRGGLGSLAQGKMPADIAYQAIEGVVSGRRHWDRERQPDLLKFLYDAVDSEMWSALVSHDNKYVTSLDDPDAIGKKPTDPADDVLAKQVLERLETLAKDDDDLQMLILYIWETGADWETGGGHAPAVAKALGWPPTKLTAVRERLAAALGTVIADIRSQDGDE